MKSKAIELLKEFRRRDWLADMGRPITDTDFKQAVNEVKQLKEENKSLKIILIISLFMYLALFVYGIILFH